MARENRISSQILQTRRSRGIKTIPTSRITTDLQVMGMDTLAVTGSNPEGVHIHHNTIEGILGILR